MNFLLKLKNHNQSIWLDEIRRDLIVDGGLKQPVAPLLARSEFTIKLHCFFEAFNLLLAHLPPDTGLAFVFVHRDRRSRRRKCLASWVCV